MTPHRVQMSRKKGWRMPPNTVYVGRPTIYGNPFIHPDPAEAVAAFRRHCQSGTQTFTLSPDGLQFAPRVHTNSLHHAWPQWLREIGLPALRGKNLACWCPLCAAHRDGKPLGVECANCSPCHADVLLELANGPTP